MSFSYKGMRHYIHITDVPPKKTQQAHQHILLVHGDNPKTKMTHHGPHC